MNNLLRTLVFDGQVSLTVADTTALVKEGAKKHRLSQDAVVPFGKTLSAMAFMSACLKRETGEISLSVKTNGAGGEIGVSGNAKLYLRGFIENTDAVGDEKTLLGETGSLTIIRDDGYARPFVGTCALERDGVDKSFEEYFRISEQLPTRFHSEVRLDENGEIAFAGIAVLQPLPFADEESLQKTVSADLQALLASVRETGIETSVENAFGKDKDVWELRFARYKCNCSKDYLKRVLVSVGETGIRQILVEEGKVEVHCHYCNTDYQFTQEDVDELFTK